MVYNYLIDLQIEDLMFIENQHKINNFLEKIANKLGLTVLKKTSYKFQPQGITSILLLKESHISIHTWPEDNFGCIDILTCKGKIDIEFIKKIISENTIGIKCLKIIQVERKAANKVYKK
jgi:S-adenosylmethionine decarboxylase